MTNQIKSAIDSIVDLDADFSMTQLYEAAWPSIEGDARLAGVIAQLKERLGSKNYKKLAQVILRNTFLIELVKVPKIETTKFRTRWFSQLDNDPRWCSFDECLEIAVELGGNAPENCLH